MKLLNFNTWENLSNIHYVNGLSLNENELARIPNDIDPKAVEAMEKRVREKVRYAITNIVKTHPFFSSAATKLKYVYTYRVETAAVDGTHMFINPMFFDPMKQKAVEFVIMHEIMHCMLLHFLRKDGRNHRKWNFATDYEINLIVSHELNYDMMADPILKDGLYDERYKGMSAEHIYNVMEYDKPSSALVNINIGKPIDEVLTPKEGRKLAEEEGIDPGGEIRPTEEDWDQELKKGAKERIKQRGSKVGSGGPLDDLVNEVLKPKVDWKSLLKRYIGSAAYREEYRIPAKRHIYKGEIRSGVWASMEALTNVVVAMDTSGSMLSYIPALFNELSGILKQDKIKELTAFSFDTKVLLPVEKLKQGQQPSPEVMKGGGGTLFVPVVKWVNENMRNAELVVIMSDGDNFDDSELSSMRKPKWAKNCIWIIVGDPTWQPPFGKVIHVPHDEFIK
jgi:predicted metal-dependent peptidase